MCARLHKEVYPQLGLPTCQLQFNPTKPVWQGQSCGEVEYKIAFSTKSQHGVDASACTVAAVAVVAAHGRGWGGRLMAFWLVPENRTVHHHSVNVGSGGRYSGRPQSFPRPCHRPAKLGPNGPQMVFPRPTPMIWCFSLKAIILRRNDSRKASLDHTGLTLKGAAGKKQRPTEVTHL